MINDYKDGIDIAITTNAYLLKDTAKKLKDAGLKRLNISLDSLKPAVAQQIAQKDVLKHVLEGIEEALKVGLKVKINSVPLKGINSDEINIKGLYGKEIVDEIRKKYYVKKIGREGSSPAFLYELEDGYRFGIIDPHKHDFCDIPCLYFDEAMSIAQAVKKGDVEAASEILREVLKNKPEKNRWDENPPEKELSNRAFYQTGG